MDFWRATGKLMLEKALGNSQLIPKALYKTTPKATGTQALRFLQQFIVLFFF